MKRPVQTEVFQKKFSAPRYKAVWRTLVSGGFGQPDPALTFL